MPTPSKRNRPRGPRTRPAASLAETAALTAARIARRKTLFESLPVCALCGNRSIFAIVPEDAEFEKRARAFFEQHHVFGRHLDPNITLRLCVSCHRETSEAMRAGGVSMGPHATLREALVAMLRALAVLFKQLAAALLAIAERLLNGELDDPFSPLTGAGR